MEVSCWSRVIETYLYLAVAALIWLCWIVGSALAIRHWKILSPGSLAAAPQRYSQFTLSHVGAVAILYFALVMLGAAVLKGVQPTAVPAVSPTTAATNPAFTPENFAVLQTLDSGVRILLVGVMLFLSHRLVVGGLRGWGLGWSQVAAGIRAGLLAGFILVPWMFVISVLTQVLSTLLRQGAMPVHPILERLGREAGWEVRLVLVSAAVLVAPVAEEMLFRGMLQTALLRWGRRLRAMAPTGFPLDNEIPPPPSTPLHVDVTPRWRWLTILISSILFTVIHLQCVGGMPANLEHMPPIFLLAVSQGYLYERTGHLWACIVLHAGFNAASTVLFLLGNA